MNSNYVRTLAAGAALLLALPIAACTTTPTPPQSTVTVTATVSTQPPATTTQPTTTTTTQYVPQPAAPETPAVTAGTPCDVSQIGQISGGLRCTGMGGSSTPRWVGMAEG